MFSGNILKNISQKISIIDLVIYVNCLDVYCDYYLLVTLLISKVLQSLFVVLQGIFSIITNNKVSNSQIENAGYFIIPD